MGVSDYVSDARSYVSDAVGLSSRIQSYGTAVCVGVFIGAALTTGVAAGVASWWAASELSGPMQDILGRVARVAAKTEAKLLGSELLAQPDEPGAAVSTGQGAPASTGGGADLAADLESLQARVVALERKAAGAD